MAGAVRSGYSWHMVTPKPGFRRPRLSRLQKQRLRRIPVRTLVPNVVTLLALCAGLTAIRMAFEDRYVLALGAIVFAAEPIIDDFYCPWGVRLDGQSAWSIRKFGWLELGFRTDYFRKTLDRLVGVDETPTDQRRCAVDGNDRRSYEYPEKDVG